MAALDRRGTFERDGFLVLEGFRTPQDCRELQARALELVAGFDPTPASPVFSTRTQAHANDDTFLSSGGAIRFFLEDGALDTAGRLCRPKAESIHKIGHALHDLDPVFERFSRAPEVAGLARELAFVQPLLLQSMYIFKQPRIGGEVVCHQDATFLYDEPQSVTGLWFALEDARRDNGCLWVLPGGHRGGLKSRFVRRPGGGTSFVHFDTTPWPEGQLVPLEVPCGSVIVLHGLLPHRSDANRSPRSRHAYTLHLLESGTSYPADNWLQRPPGMPLRGFDG